MSPLLIGFFRVGIAAVALWLVNRLGGEPYPPLTAGDRWRLLVAGLSMAGYQVCYFYGVAKTSVTVGALIAICSAPIMIMTLAALLLAEPLTPERVAALALGVTGAALLTVGPHGLGGLPAGFAAGIALALGAGFCYALYAVVVRDVVARVPPLAVASITFAVAAVGLAPALALEPAVGGLRAWLLVAYLGLVPTTLAYVLYVRAMRSTPAAVSGVLGLTEPLTATLLGVLLFGDRLGLRGVVGAALLIGAAGLLGERPAPVASRR
jgi:DME family drug/metabolite transporter